MKRLWLAAAILVAITGLCTVTLVYLNRQTDRLTEQIDHIETAIVQGDVATAISATQQFLEDYEKHTRYFTWFMRHAELEESHKVACTLLPILTSGHTQEFRENLLKLRKILELMTEAEEPLPQNIF